MTKKTKKLSLFGIIVVVLFTFINCEYDEKTIDYQKQDQSDNNLKVSKVNFNQFKNNKKLMDKLGNIKNTTQQTTARLIQANDGSFSINTDLAYLIESENGNHSYTFQIIRQNPQYRLENLILKENDSTGYNLYIAQYNITELEFEQLQNGENPTIINKLTIVPVANNIINTTNILNRGSAEGMCLTETVVPGNTCPGPEHHTFEDIMGNVLAGGNGGCPYFVNGGFTAYAQKTIYSWGPCGQDDGGGGNPIDNGNYDNPGLTGGGVNTTPTFNSTIKKPCEEIKKITDKPAFATNMQVLKNNINGTKEKGFIIRDKTGTDAFSPVVEGNSDGTITYPYADSTPAELDLLFSSIGTAHNHITTINTQIGIFTPEDLGNLLLNGLIETHLQNPNRSTTPKKAVIFVITDKGFFALKINNLTKLQAFCIDYASWSKERTEKYMKEHFQDPEEYNITPTSTKQEQITGFLRFMQDQDIGIDLYEGNKDTFGNWNKLDLTENNGNFTYTPTPCNN